MSDADVTDYVKLREEVKQLKFERRECLRAHHARKMLGERALAEIRDEYEEELRMRDREIARLKKSVRESTQRESRQRSRFDKDVKSLEMQIRKANSGLQEERAAREAEHSRLQNEKEKALRTAAEEWKDLIRAQQGEQSLDYAQRLRAMKDRCDELQKNQEIRLDSVAALFSAICQRTSNLANEWWKRLNEAQYKLDRLHSGFEASRKKSRAVCEVTRNLGRLCQRRQGALKNAKEGSERLGSEIVEQQQEHQRQLKDIKKDYTHKIAQIKARHSQELETIQTNLEDVLSKKEQTITNLTQEIHALKELLRAQDATILAFDEDVHSVDLP